MRNMSFMLIDEPGKKQELIVKYQLAVKVAIKAIDKEMHQYAVDANLFRRGLVSIAGERANKEYTKLENAKERLKQGRWTKCNLGIDKE